MRNLGLDKISPKGDNQELIDLIVGTYYRYINRDGKNLQPKNFRAELRKGRTKLKEGNFDIYRQKFDNFRGQTLQDFADFSGHDLIFWVGVKNSNKQRQLIRIESDMSVNESHFAVSVNFKSVLNANYLIKNLPRLVLVQDIKYLTLRMTEKYPEKNIFEWLSDKTGRPKEQLLLEFPDGITFRQERDFHSKFGVGFQIFTRKETENVKPSIQIAYKSLFESYLNLEFLEEWEDCTVISPTDSFRLHKENKTDYVCPFEYCEFATQRKVKLDSHVQTCTNTTEIEYRQEDMTSKTKIREFLIENNYLDANYVNKNFMVVDIESFGSKDSAREVSELTAIISEQKIVTCAFSKNFGTLENRTVCFTRDSFSYDDYLSFFSQIGHFLKLTCMEYIKSLPQSILDSTVKLETQIKEYKNTFKNSNEPGSRDFENDREFTQKEFFLMKAGLTYLKKLQTLRIFGFNSEKYDFPIFLPGLLGSWNLTQNQINCIKRGTGLMSIDLNLDGQRFEFLDARNYLAGGSLAQFGEIFGSETTKGTFCYEYFQTIEQARQCEVWPDFNHFHSSLSYPVRNIVDKFHKAFDLASSKLQMSAEQFLIKMSIPHESYKISDDPFELPEIDFNKTELLKQTLNPVIYIEGLISFTELKELGVVDNMFDFLAYYNKDDVKILLTALENYVSLFIDNLNINPLDFISLPGLAERIMWSKFDGRIGAPYSFDNGKLNTEIRDGRTGGIVSILTNRHVIIGVLPSERVYNDTVYTVPNGDMISELISYDFNNLYGHAMRMNMPVGPGIFYEKTGQFFTWEPLMDPRKKKYSFEAIEWLNKMEFDLKNSDGSRNVIHHAMNSGEREFKKTYYCPITDKNKLKIYKPDGYALINGTEHFFEYDGCYDHICIHNCSTSRKSRRNKARDDGARNDFYRERGILHTMTSCQWKKQRSSQRFPIHTSVFFNQKRITEQKIMNKIKSGKFFGLVKLDLKSPQRVIDKFLKLNFPPIFRHLNIDPEMIHEEYKKKMTSQSRKFDTLSVLSQTFHADQILLTTETALFYHKLGLELSNLTMAIEFEKDRPFADFVNQITAERKKATRMKNKPLQDIFKLVMNSSYGRTGMCLEKHTNVRFQEKSIKRRYNNFEKYSEPLIGEFPTDYIEIVSRKRKITDNIPVLYNFFILANSKLHILNSINFFLDNLDTSGFRINYMDTDSMVMSLSKPLDELVLPDRESIWKAQKPNWFVTDPECPDQKREPGLLKEEFSIQSGSAVFLSPKCYIMEDKDSGQVKKALKGIHSGTMIEYDDFVEVLYNNSTVMRDQTRLKRNLKKFTVQLQNEKKKALNSVYFKLKVSDDFITCSPHTDEHGNYLMSQKLETRVQILGQSQNSRQQNNESKLNQIYSYDFNALYGGAMSNSIKLPKMLKNGKYINEHKSEFAAEECTATNSGQIIHEMEEI